MGIGLAVGWVGYTLAYFGFCSIKGPGVGLLDLVIPGRTVTIPAGGSAQASGPNIPGGGAGGSTITTDPSSGKITHIDPGPGDNNPQPGGTFA